MPQRLGDLPLLATVKDVDSKYYGKPIVWRIVDKDHTGYPENSVTLQTDKIISLKCFDAREPQNIDPNRKDWGNNRYIHSNLRQWLNSDKADGTWYTAQHGTDMPPNPDVTFYNPYSNNGGFLAGFSNALKSSLLATTLFVTKNKVSDGGGSESCTDKIFIASTTEVGLANENSIAEGIKLEAYSGSNMSRNAYPTAEAVSNNNFVDSRLRPDSHWIWWLRTPSSSYSYQARCVNGSGYLDSNSAYSGTMGVRPLCNISADTLVTDNPDLDGNYIIIWNTPPTNPTNITIPEIIAANTTITISWGNSTDVDGSVFGYILERNANETTWVQIYKGTEKTHNDTIDRSWTSVQYRVKSYDNENAESGYTTSALKDVIINNAPVISSQNNDDLGTFGTTGLTLTYTVSDIDNDSLTVTEKINTTVIRTHQPALDTPITLTLSGNAWLEVPNGMNTITISATDIAGATTNKVFTFIKNVTELSITLAEPLQADDMITKAVMAVTRQIPQGATFTVEVCNNGYDDEPTWEDVTQNVLSGLKFNFANDQKTSENWGFNLRITVERGDVPVGEKIFVAGIGGNFE